MVNSVKAERNFNLSSVLWGLYTLSENDQFFKKISLKNDIFININSNDYFSTQVEKCYEFSKLLNKTSLRRFSYSLLKPFLTENYIKDALESKNKEWAKDCYAEIILLKQYLRKFKYNYRAYFVGQGENFYNLRSDKELNTSALHTLFLLSGI